MTHARYSESKPRYVTGEPECEFPPALLAELKVNADWKTANALCKEMFVYVESPLTIVFRPTITGRLDRLQQGPITTLPDSLSWQVIGTVAKGSQLLQWAGTLDGKSITVLRALLKQCVGALRMNKRTEVT